MSNGVALALADAHGYKDLPPRYAVVMLWVITSLASRRRQTLARWGWRWSMDEVRYRIAHEKGPLEAALLGAFLTRWMTTCYISQTFLMRVG